MAWTGQTFSVGQILTAAQMNNLQADITALANGDSGAPSIQSAALDTGTDEDSWVLDRTAGASAGGVGTYMVATLGAADTGATAFGATKAGSSLKPTAVEESNDGSATDIIAEAASAQSGTWRCMGDIRASNSDEAVASLWLRIS